MYILPQYLPSQTEPTKDMERYGLVKGSRSYVNSIAFADFELLTILLCVFYTLF